MSIESRVPKLGVDVTCPIEWGHPLNRGLVGEWAVIPNAGWRGGLTFRDLVRGGRNPHDGTLVSGPLWVGPRGRPGGYGALSFGTVNSEYVSTNLRVNASAFTLSLWANIADTTNPYCGMLGGGFSGTSQSVSSINKGVELSLYNNVYCRVGNGTTSADANGSLPTAGKWEHWTVTYDGSTIQIYRNGITNGTPGTISGAVIDPSPTFGIRQFGYQTFTNILIDGVTVHSRALTAAQVFALFDQSRRFNSERRRRLSTKSFFYTSIVSTTNTQTRSFSTDLSKLKTILVTLLTDTYLQVPLQTIQKNLNTDVLKYLRSLLNYSVDSLLQKTIILSDTTNSLLFRTSVLNDTVDVLLKASPTKTDTIDVLVQKTQNLSETTDVLLKALQTKQFNTNVLLLKTQVQQDTTDVLMSGSVSKTLFTNTLIYRTTNLNQTVDVYSVLRNTHNYSIDTLLVGVPHVNLTFDTLAKATTTKTLQQDSFLSRTSVLQDTTNVFTKATSTEHYQVDTLLKAIRVSTVQTDLLIYNQTTKTSSTDVGLKRLGQLLASTQSFLQGSPIKIATVDLIASHRQLQFLNTDANIFARRNLIYQSNILTQFSPLKFVKTDALFTTSGHMFITTDVLIKRFPPPVISRRSIRLNLKNYRSVRSNQW